MVEVEDIVRVGPAQVVEIRPATRIAILLHGQKVLRVADALRPSEGVRRTKPRRVRVELTGVADVLHLRLQQRGVLALRGHAGVVLPVIG